jgi:hypothetical protein
MSMKVREFGIYLNGLSGAIDELRLAQESLEFCRDVYARYVVNNEPANEHMDADKATAQLIEAIDRILKV